MTHLDASLAPEVTPALRQAVQRYRRAARRYAAEQAVARRLGRNLPGGSDDEFRQADAHEADSLAPALERFTAAERALRSAIWRMNRRWAIVDDVRYLARDSDGNGGPLIRAFRVRS